MPVGSTRPTLLTRNFLFLVSAHFLQALGYSSMLLLPLYLSFLGASRAEIGTIMATGAFAGLVFRPVVGWALDAIGRKPTLIAGTLALALGMALFLFVHSLGPMVYIARIFIGVGVGALFTGYFTLAADIIPESRRTEGLALFGISGLAPLMVNPFADQLGVVGPELRLLFPAVGVLILLSILALRPISEPNRPQTRPGGTKITLSVVISAFQRRSLRPVWLATIIFAGLVGIFMSFATVVAADRGMESPANIWFTYALGAISIRAVGARLPDRIGPSNIVAPALAAYVVGYLLVAQATTPELFLWAGFLGGLGHGYCFPVLSSQVVSRMPDRLRGAGMAMFTGVWGLTAVLANPILGLFADRFGDATMFSVAALIAIIGLAAWTWLEHRFGALS